MVNTRRHGQHSQYLTLSRTGPLAGEPFREPAQPVRRPGHRRVDAAQLVDQRMCLGDPGRGGLPPPGHRIATGINDIPMTVITVPATTGGKNLRSLLKYGAASAVRSPATMIEP